MAVAAAVQRDANEQLQLALVGTTCIRLKEYDLSRGFFNEEKYTYLNTEDDTFAIEALISNLQVDNRQGAAYSKRYHCLWVSEHAIEFYHGAQLLASLSAVRGKFLRWHDVWLGDPELLPGHIEAVFKWLSVRGITHPLDMYENAMAEVRRKAEVEQVALSSLPTGVRDVFMDTSRDWRDFVTVASLLNVSHLVLAGMLLRVCGATNEEWRTEDKLAGEAMYFLSNIQWQILLQATESALMGVDRIARRGAVRVWISDCCPFALFNWEQAAPAACRLVALDVLQESRCIAHRELATKHLQEWGASLPEAEVETRLLSLLADPELRVRRCALATACLLNVPAAVPLLMEVLQGREMPVIPLAPVPPYEDYVPEDSPFTENIKYMNKDGSLVDLAGLALGYRSYEPSRPFLLQAYEATKSLYLTVALALLGDTDRLKNRRLARAAARSEVLNLAVREVFARANAAGAPVSESELAEHGWDL